MPWLLQYHCAAYVNKTHGIVTGGMLEKRTFFVNLNDVGSGFTTGPPMSTKKEHGNCGNFQHPNGTYFVVVAGSYPDKQLVELLNVDRIEDGWYEGKFLKGCSMLVNYTKIYNSPSIIQVQVCLKIAMGVRLLQCQIY